MSAQVDGPCLGRNRGLTGGDRSGGAGLAAAIQAHDEGASVLIVEKMPTIGGNTIKASAGMNAAETRFQRVKGIQDNKELSIRKP